MKAKELWQAGDLKGALQAATEDVKRRPADTSLREFLCGLLCFAGDLERADKQLDAIGHQDVDAAVGVALLRHLVRGEVARRGFFEQGHLPDFLGEPTPALRLHLQASVLLREGQTSEASELLAQAEEVRPRVKGSSDGTPFDDLRDLDDVTAPFLEVLTSTGKYYWVPFERVESIEIRPPEKWPDLLWRSAHLLVDDGPDGEVYLPALYVGSHLNDDDQIRLGRGTDWLEIEGGPTRGRGQRTLLVGDVDRPFMEIGQITVDHG